MHFLTALYFAKVGHDSESKHKNDEFAKGPFRLRRITAIAHTNASKRTANAWIVCMTEILNHGY